MFNIDKVIEESNKKMLYGDKPEIPDQLTNMSILDENGSCVAIKEPSIKNIVKTINKIIEYLEWINK